MLRSSILVSLLGSAFADDCGSIQDCTTCIQGSSCAWCAPNPVVYQNGSKGTRCAKAGDPWTCTPRTQTDQCIIGYVCTGPPDYKCVPSGIPGEGSPDYPSCLNSCGVYANFKCDSSDMTCKQCTPGETGCTTYDDCTDACIDVSRYKCIPGSTNCTKCDPSDMTCTATKSECETSGYCQVAYECDYPSILNASAQPQCKPCTGTQCRYSSLTECTKPNACAWGYSCNATSQTCDLAQHGDPTKSQCEAHCSTGFTCEDSSPGTGQCKVSQGGGAQNKTDCDANCPTKPTNSTPFELRGVWRGYAIQNGYKFGEWTAYVNETYVTIWDDAKKVFVEGMTQSWQPKGSIAKAQVFIDSTVGTLTGTVRMIYGDRQLDPELSYVALAVDTVKPATAPLDWDPAMTTTGQMLIGMYKCKDDAKNCKFHLPTNTTALKATSSRKLFSAAVDAPATDPCNAFSTCGGCVGQSTGGQSCGWCLGELHYNGTKVTSQCAGWVAGHGTGWKCYGTFGFACPEYYECTSGQCSKTADPSKFPSKKLCDANCGSPYGTCDLDGIYRGLQIDINYGFGEWRAVFNKTNQTATFSFPATGYWYSGKMACKKPSSTSTSGILMLTLTNSTVLYGLYTTGSDQVETTGLSLAMANLGAVGAPADFDSAMEGLDAQVFGYTKCASYKSATCKF